MEHKSQLEEDIDYILEAVKYISFDSQNHDWPKHNTEEPKDPDEDFPLYIKLWNQYGSSWGYMKQHYAWDDTISYWGGTNVTVNLNKDSRRIFQVRSYGMTPFELFYEEVSREEFVHYYREMCEKAVGREQVNLPKPEDKRESELERAIARNQNKEKELLRELKRIRKEAEDLTEKQRNIQTVNYVVSIQDFKGHRDIECETEQQVWDAIETSGFSGLYQVSSPTGKDVYDFIPY